ncbi:MAG: MFS transporter [Pirellulaceae bacterium]|nr:MFS transporter [Pirellulaceae bacterium]MDP7017395.1 MFS transporter [Pirellulaceae bacterium]
MNIRLEEQPVLPDHTTATVARSATPDLESPASRNFALMALYQVVMRTGWIFKTESIIMPAVLDSLGCGPMVRGFLPLLNRLGQSVPPMLMARRVKVAPRKKYLMSACAFSMAAVFFALALLWSRWGSQPPVWLPVAFLACYAVFFVSTGVHQICFTTLQGKLVRTTRRGRLMLVASLVGAISACSFAAVFMPTWLATGGGQFQYIFAFSACCFLLAALGALLMREDRDTHAEAATSVARVFEAARDTLRHDRNFRRLAWVAALFGVSVMLFPHYQALARERLGMSFTNMTMWVIVQNAGTAFFSILMGPIADRRGNRLVLWCVLITICVAPISALVLSYSGNLGSQLFPLVFVVVGLTPVVIKTLHNYTLEISPPADHPRYLSTLSLCFAGPVILSPLVGCAVGWLGFDVVFLALTVFVVAGWWLSFGLVEPRHKRHVHAQDELPLG